MERAARRIVTILRSHGHEALFAGGWVRDHLLGRRPKDIDIATSARPEEVFRIFRCARAIGARFAVVQVRSYGRAYDVATFRSEGPYLDGRHPSAVSFTGPRADAKRRDFTINGLFFDPISGEVHDFVCGRRDLGRRSVRTIGPPETRFGEDRLRMLRAVRFACELGFEVDARTWRSIQSNAPAILQVSAERIRDELLKILTGPAPDRGLHMLCESRLLAAVLPEVEAMRGVAQPPEFHPEGDVFTHTALVLRRLRKPSAVLALAALLHDVGKPPTCELRERIRFDRHTETGAEMAAAICRRLRLSNDAAERVVALVRHHLHFMHVHEMRRSTLLKFLRMPHFADHLELHRADCLGSHRNLDSYHFCLGKMRELELEKPAPPPLLAGRDLIEMGYAPGPLFGRILRAVAELQLENALRSPEEARRFVIQNYPLEGSGKTP